MSIIPPPSNFNFTSPIVYVDIYPLLSTPSNSITLTPTNSGLSQLRVEKSIRGQSNAGRFSFVLTPGGSTGVDDNISWTSIITQYSLCVIYGSRGNSNSILMVGLVSSVTERQLWNNEKVIRTIEIQGFDFTLYFTTFAYYVLYYLGFINTLPIEFGPAGTAILSNNGQLQGAPNLIGANWFTDEFLGFPGNFPSAVLQNTYITYKGKNVPLFDLMTYWFEPYTTTAGTPIIIPVLTDFLINEGTFYDKFIQIFPFPFYEFFINTVPHDYYSNQIAPPAVSVTTQVGSFTPADVVVVARVNPLPTVDVDSKGNFQLRRDKWDALDQYNIAPYSYIESEVMYDVEDIKNFYVISPLGIMTAPGGSPGGNLAPAIEQMGFLYDTDSINKYGFRSKVDSIIWWVDPDFVIAASTATFNPSGTTAIPSTLQYESFLLRSSSYYEPLPNMLHGTVKIPFWPSIIVGNKFEYSPFKNSIPYTFYITGVSHIYDFGHDSFTVLELERGLPSSIYENSNNLLLQLHLGQVERVNGEIVPTSGVGLRYGSILTTDPFTNTPGMGAYGSVNPTVLPSNTNNSYDSIFQTTTTPCGTQIDWRLLKALAMSESYPSMTGLGPTPDSHGVLHYGIMQVSATSDPTHTDPNLLLNDPSYNIQAGANVLCTMLTSHGGSMLQALSYYKGFTNGYNNPAAQGPVNSVLGWYYAMGGVPITS